MTPETLAHIIKNRKKILKINSSQLVEMSGVSRGALSNILNCKSSPTIETINKFAEVLGMELKLEVKKIDYQEDLSKEPDVKEKNAAKVMIIYKDFRCETEMPKIPEKNEKISFFYKDNRKRRSINYVEHCFDRQGKYQVTEVHLLEIKAMNKIMTAEEWLKYEIKRQKPNCTPYEFEYLLNTFHKLSAMQLYTGYVNKKLIEFIKKEQELNNAFIYLFDSEAILKQFNND